VGLSRIWKNLVKWTVAISHCFFFLEREVRRMRKWAALEFEASITRENGKTTKKANDCWQIEDSTSIECGVLL
jgi:hypothetical protein